MVQNGDLFPECVSDPLGRESSGTDNSSGCPLILHAAEERYTAQRTVLSCFTLFSVYARFSRGVFLFIPSFLSCLSPHIFIQVLALTWTRPNFSRQGFGRGGNNKNNTNNNTNNNAAPKSPAPLPVAQAPQISPAPNSPSLGSPLPMDSPAAYDPDAPKYFFQEKYAPLNVRGNFLTLCACPKNVELGEWLAHQSKQRSLRGMAGVYLPEIDTI